MIDWIAAPAEVFIAFGIGCTTTYTFVMRTAVSNLKERLKQEKDLFQEQLEREREVFEQRLKDERRGCETQINILKDSLLSFEKRIERYEKE